MLVVENGCREAPGTGPCPAPVGDLSVTFNGQVVFQAATAFEGYHARLAAGAVSADQDNQLTISAAGTPGSAARVRILATPMNRSGRTYAANLPAGLGVMPGDKLSTTPGRGTS